LATTAILPESARLRAFVFQGDVTRGLDEARFFGYRAGVPRRLRVVDLFCGAGGLSLGFAQAGFEIALAVDKDEDSCKTYQANHPKVVVEKIDISKVTSEHIANIVDGHVDVIIGGPSCQGFSTAGRKSGWVREDDERNKLWSHMFGLVKTLKPRAFLLENVPGLVYWKEGHLGHTILRQFESEGYAVDVRILMAADYGVPQVRRRVFMVGIHGQKRFRFPDPTHVGGWRRDTIEYWNDRRRERKLPRHITCWEAIADLPAIGRSVGAGTTILRQSKAQTPYAKVLRGRADHLHDHVVSPLAEDHLRLLQWVPQGGTWRDIPPHLLPERYFGMRRTDSSTLLGRLDPNRPAYTITTEFNNPTAGCFVHPWEDRVLSIREGARLQSFPDWYEFYGSVRSRYRQVGNAVPPRLARFLASSLARQVAPASARVYCVSPKQGRPGDQPPPPSDPLTRRRMQNQRRLDTRPEVMLRKELHARGLRFRVGIKPVRGLRREIDVAFPTAKVAVFVDGCFWHGCPIHARPTKAHTFWWADKIGRNKERDLETIELLTSLGWRVVRIWEHQQPNDAADAVELVLRGTQGGEVELSGPTSRLVEEAAD
jgi:DNA (cytosine-5)-methyltransferase 1